MKDKIQEVIFEPAYSQILDEKTLVEEDLHEENFNGYAFSEENYPNPELVERVR